MRKMVTCDLCGTLQEYPWGISRTVILDGGVGDRRHLGWSGNVCAECFEEMKLAADEAALATIAEIQARNGMTNDD